ncbi:hypothetical protein [Methylobacterium sp. WSM2598]|nr:hypothetical protein [Methylobacterium sp. WSM2598]
MNHQRRPPKGWVVVVSSIQSSEWRFSLFERVVVKCRRKRPCSAPRWAS